MSTAFASGLRPEVVDFLSQDTLQAVIGGQSVPSATGETFETKDPGSGESLAEVHAMQPEDVDRAIRAADKAFRVSGWATMAPNDRGVLLRRLADAVEKHNSTTWISTRRPTSWSRRSRFTRGRSVATPRAG